MAGAAASVQLTDARSAGPPGVTPMPAALARAVLLLALADPATPEPPAPEGVRAGYRQLAAAIENKNTAGLATVLDDSFEYLPFEGRATGRTDWLGTWSRNFTEVEAYSAAAYELHFAVAAPRHVSRRRRANHFLPAPGPATNRCRCAGRKTNGSSWAVTGGSGPNGNGASPTMARWSRPSARPRANGCAAYSGT